MEEISLIEIISLFISLLAVIISYFCYLNSKRKVFTNAYSEYRIDWINNVRDLLANFLQCKISSNNKNKLCKIKYKIDLYLNFKYEDHLDLSLSLDKLIEDKIEIDIVISKSQILIDNYWRKAKAEARMNKKTNQKIRKNTYNDGRLYD